MVAMLCVVWALLGVACSAGPASQNQNNNADTKDYSTKLSTGSKAFEVSYGEIKDAEGKVYETVPFNKIFSMVLTVTGSLAEGKEPVIEAIMPEHKHGMNTKPKLKSLPDGKYEVTGMLFHMPGWWTIKVELPSSGGEVESVTFNVMLKIQ